MTVFKYLTTLDTAKASRLNTFLHRNKPVCHRQFNSGHLNSYPTKLVTTFDCLFDPTYSVSNHPKATGTATFQAAPSSHEAQLHPMVARELATSCLAQHIEKITEVLGVLDHDETVSLIKVFNSFAFLQVFRKKSSEALKHASLKLIAPKHCPAPFPTFWSGHLFGRHHWLLYHHGHHGHFCRQRSGVASAAHSEPAHHPGAADCRLLLELVQ